MSVTDEAVVLLAPEEESVAEHALHEQLVDLLFAGLSARFTGRDDVAVHARLAWFPDRDDTRVRLDPDVLIAFGRPPQSRSSYRTWDEAGVPPTIIVEVWSAHDTDAGYAERLARARRHGVAEVVLIAAFAPGGVRVEHLLPDPADPSGWRARAVSIAPEQWVAVERLGIRMSGGPELTVADNGEPWPSTPQAFLRYRREAARADEQTARADEQTARAERLAGQLRAAGMDPDEG